VNLHQTNQRKIYLLQTFLIATLILVALTKFFKTSDVYDPSWIQYSIENAYSNAEGELEVKIFPQWKNANWFLKLPSGKYEYYK